MTLARDKEICKETVQHPLSSSFLRDLSYSNKENLASGLLKNIDKAVNKKL